MATNRTHLRLPAILGATLLLLSGVTSAAGVGACLHHGASGHGADTTEAESAQTSPDHHSPHGAHAHHGDGAHGLEAHPAEHDEPHEHECDCENPLLCVGGVAITSTAATPTLSASPPPERAILAPASARSADLPSSTLAPFVLPYSNAPPTHV